MAETIATEEVVFAAATAMWAQGQKPTIRLLQQKTGGSYTTIKRHLDAWTLEQEMKAQEAFAAPEAVLDKGHELARSLWALARNESQKEVQLAKDQAQTEIASLSQELEFAQGAIGRMEEAEQAHKLALAQCTTQLQETHRLLEETRIVAAKVPDLETRLATALAMNDELHQAATVAAHENGRLTGEASSLRQQVQELTEALVKLKSPPSSPT